MSVKKITVRFLDPDDEVSGAGWLFADGKILTCAHVINRALGRTLPEHPDPPTADVWVLHSEDSTGASKARATVTTWLPPKRAPDGGYSDDIAILEVIGGGTHYDSGYQNLMWPRVTAQVDAWGYPGDPQWGRSAAGFLGMSTGGRVEVLALDGRPMSLERGFSGAPVVNGGNVVGIVASIHGRTRISYVISPQTIAEHVADDVNTLPATAGVALHLKGLLRQLRQDDQREFPMNLRAEQVSDKDAVSEMQRRPPPDTYVSTKHMTPLALLKLAEKHTTILLTAPGGSGKTHFFIDMVMEELFGTDRIAFWLDLRRLKAVREAGAAITPQRVFDGSSIAGDWDLFRDLISKGHHISIYADGLNELGDDRQTIAEQLQNICTLYPNARLYIGDRLTPTKLNDHLLVTLTPLCKQTIERTIRKSGLSAPSLTLLSSPFFLSLWVKVTDDPSSATEIRRDGIFQKYFTDHVFSGNGAAVDLAAVQSAAFALYREEKSLTAPEPKWKAAGFDDLALGCLKQSLAVLSHNSKTGVELEFRHQLFHDWCAAAHVSRQKPADWNSTLFNDLTLQGASTDALDLAVEQMHPDRTELFLTRAYDWRWMAVLQAVLNLEFQAHGAPSPLTAAFRDALFALNTLRQFDRFEHTRGNAERLVIEYAKIPGALDITKPKDVEDVVEKYTKAHKRDELNPLLTQWLAEFEKDGAAAASEVEGLASLAATSEEGVEVVEPFTSWTASNIIRIRDVRPEFAKAAIEAYKMLRRMAFAQRDAVSTRWRIVHTLGAVKIPAMQPLVTQFLFKVLLDHSEEANVRFGAARSLMEQALLADYTRRKEIFRDLTANIGMIDPGMPSTVRGELRQATILSTKRPAGPADLSTKRPAGPADLSTKRPAGPADWYPLVLELLKSGMAVTDAKDVKNWESRILEVEALMKAMEKKP